MRKIIFGVIFILGLTVSIGSLGIELFYESNLWNNETITFTDPLGYKIHNKYYPGTLDTGIMLFHGFGEDIYSMKNLALRFNIEGYHVFATDFSGHGSSSGILPSGPNSNNSLVNQAIMALDVFINVSGLAQNKIFMLGHSMGARVVLQAAAQNNTNVGGIILLGGGAFAPLNSTNGDWTDFLGIDNPKTDVLIVTGTWEDVFTPTEAMQLYERLSGEEADSKFENNLTSGGYYRGLAIIDYLPHTYEPSCNRVSVVVLQWITSNYAYKPCPCLNSGFGIRKLMIIFQAVGLAIFAIFGTLLFERVDVFDIIKKPKENSEELNKLTESELDIRITDFKRYFSFKPLIYIGGGILGMTLSLLATATCVIAVCLFYPKIKHTYSSTHPYVRS
ncbi:MAG: alpha/beta hydrolase, partial [Candidatus Thorarchaeota archaeon]